MGEQTTIALLGFAACHIALILNVIAISTNQWVEAEETGAGANGTINKGLWEICRSHGDGEECENVEEDDQAGGQEVC